MSKKKDNKKKDLQPMFHEGHKLKSRRDFLAQGFLSMATYTMLPSVLSMLKANSAHALECAVNVNSAESLPVIIFDLAGGANIAGSNVMVGGAGGQMDFLQDYQTLGLPPDMHPSMPGQINNEMGLVFHSDSAFLRGIQAETSTQIRQKVDGAIFCTSSSDDTQNNPHNPVYWLNKAGAKGGLTQLAGTRDTDSGGRSLAPMASIDPTLRPVQLNRPSDALNLVNVGKLGELFDEQKAKRILKAVERMSERKVMSFSQQSLPMQIKELVNCGYIRSNDLIGKYSADALDPSRDAMVTNLFNMNNGNERKTATIAKLVLDGHIGAGTVEKGGYDYHGGARARGETRDFEAGELIGKVMSLAALKQKSVVIYVFTDGGVVANSTPDNSNEGRGKFEWTGDSGQRSSSFMLVYGHNGKPAIRNGIRQIGHFKNNGAVENAALRTSNSVVNLAKAVVANYLALLGLEGNLAQAVGDNPFGASLENYLVFNKLA